MLRRRFVSLLLAAALAAPLAAATGSGAVVSSETDATAAGSRVLAGGGNAVDAAVATALALVVVHPGAGNLGGGGFALVRVAGALAALDFRETAPARARPDLYLDAHGDPVPDASLIGPLAAGVPGSPAGLWELHRRFGRLPWSAVVAPALALARDGFVVSAKLERSLAEDQTKLARFPETATVWLPGGRPLAAGTHLALPALAETLAAYAARGPAGISAGPAARAIEEASRLHGGVLTVADLAAYQPVWREPLRFERFGWQVAAMPLPSSGGILLGETMGILERRGWSERARGSADRVHLLIEALRRAFADRYRLGDPATTGATAVDLLARPWLDRRAAEIDPRRATASVQVQPYPAAAPREPDHTTQVTVADGDGNLVALTTTLNDFYGCRLWVPGAGYFLNNEMDDFTVAAGRPNLFGLIQGEENAVGPGKRMLSSMSPTIAWHDEEAIALGGRGGSRIPSAVIQVLLAMFEGATAADAVARPRIHEQWLPDQVLVEAGALAPEIEIDLARRGHFLMPPRADQQAVVNAVHLCADGSVEAGGDPRGPEVSGVATVVAPGGGRR
jgi:gamma-glutamyltranspeptidase/glutathione hydrolase